MKHHFALSPRQAECLSASRAGESTRQIAERLGIGPRVVSNHILCARQKLRAEQVRLINDNTPRRKEIA